MRTPQVAAPLFFFLDPAKKYVAFAQGQSPPTSLAVSSVIERANGKPVYAPVAGPVWASNSFFGTFASGGTPGGGLAGQQAGLTFNGSTQYLEFDSLASTLASGTDPSLTIVCQAKCSSASGTNQTLWAFGSSTGTPTLTCAISDGYLTLIELNSSSTFTASYSAFTVPGTNNEAANVITAVRTKTALTLRVNGVQVATAALTAVPGVFTTFTVGAQNTGGSVGGWFTGVLGKLLAFGSNTGGMADIVDLETQLMLDCGIKQF